MNLEQIERKVVQWGIDKGLQSVSYVAKRQLVKLLEEVGELASAIALEKDIADAVGDILVVLTQIAHSEGLTLSRCYEIAWCEIKNRQGKTIDGIFVKEE